MLQSDDPNSDETERERRRNDAGERMESVTSDDGPIEIWGRRIGRTLGWIVMGVLLLQLLRNWNS